MDFGAPELADLSAESGKIELRVAYRFADADELAHRAGQPVFLCGCAEMTQERRNSD